jgi:hypothetical protein
MADDGLTVSEIKSLTKHKSSTVVEGYIDSSVPQKRKAAQAVRLSTSSSMSSSSSSCRCSHLEIPAGQGQGPLVLHLSGTFNIGGSLNVMVGSSAAPASQIVSSTTMETNDVVMDSQKEHV